MFLKKVRVHRDYRNWSMVPSFLEQDSIKLLLIFENNDNTYDSKQSSV